MIKIITGLRRSGKSYLLFTLFRNYLHDNGIDDSHIVQIDFEDINNEPLRDPLAILNHIKQCITDGKEYYVLIDEVQKLNRFEDVLNTLLKNQQVDVYVTGSNSYLLSKDIITTFRGRGDEIRIHPLSFSEYMSIKPDAAFLENYLNDYMYLGGMPQIQSMRTDTEKKDYLQHLFANTYILDIKERYGIKNDDDLEELIDVVASSIGSLTNPLKIENTFRSAKKSNITRDTIKNYLDYMQDAFMIEKAVRYDIKGRKYIDTPAKYYFEDTGLRNARLNFRQNEPTHLMENLVYNELRIRGFSVDVGMVTHNTRNANGVSERVQLEVDFVVNRGMQRYYIQSALHIEDEDKRIQETNSLNRINDSYKKVVVVKDDIIPWRDEKGILYVGIREFLLDDRSLEL